MPDKIDDLSAQLVQAVIDDGRSLFQETYSPPFTPVKGVVAGEYWIVTVRRVPRMEPEVMKLDLPAEVLVAPV